MRSAFKVSLGGAAAALGLVLMFMTAIIPFGTYAFPTFAGVLLVAVVIEIGYSLAIGVYIVTAILSFLLAPDKEAALWYAIFMGYYPVIKSLIERLRSMIAQYLIKFLIFNACVIAAFFIAAYLLSIPKESYTIFGVYMPLLFLLLGNIYFLLYDICITRIVTIYLLKWHNKLNKNTKL